MAPIARLEIVSDTQHLKNEFCDSLWNEFCDGLCQSFCRCSISGSGKALTAEIAEKNRGERRENLFPDAGDWRSLAIVCGQGL